MSEGNGGGSTIIQFSAGSVLAIVISYMDNHSIVWALIHGIMGWLFVLYKIAVVMGWVGGIDWMGIYNFP
ncbi:MAG: hypothetical protein ABIH11_07695 [Candidatus Altiarchaeota archaeon]